MRLYHIPHGQLVCLTSDSLFSHTWFSWNFIFSYLLPSQPSRGKQKTGICRRTTSPRWEQTICWDDLTIEDVSDRSLELAIWDHDRLGHQDFLGGARFNLGTGNDKFSHVAVTWLWCENLIAIWTPNFCSGSFGYSGSIGNYPSCLWLFWSHHINSVLPCCLFTLSSVVSISSFCSFQETKFTNFSGKHGGRPCAWMDSTGKEVTLWQQMLDRPNFWVEGSISLRAVLETTKPENKWKNFQ